ncbi:MAG TPA: two-component regulator propeller domain-containing protein [Candidatus Saccharimonadaceae bacterium]|jgi:ligand-binding sensor domain-containing protein|nr:two-component regulator propeller domain-containing protein [Candidatus Saccharimonadaceae bacterium]
MSNRLALPVALLVLAAAPAASFAAGAWTTYIRPFTYNQLVAGADTVWCATEEAGLLRYVRSAGRFDQVTREPGALASNELTSLAFDRRGRLWMGTRDAGVAYLDANGAWGLLNAFDGLPSLSVNALTAQGDTLWIATTAGLALWNGIEVSGSIPDGSGTSPFANNDILGVAVRGDSLWVATGFGVYYSLLSGGLATWIESDGNLALDQIRGMATDGTDVFVLSESPAIVLRAQPGGTWSNVGGINNAFRLSSGGGAVFASSDLGTYRWNGGGWTQLSAALTSGFQPDRALSVTQDATGHVFAADRNGLYEQAASDPWPVALPESPPGNDVQSLGIEGSRLYAGTFQEGVGRLESTDGTWFNWYPTGCSGACPSDFLTSAFTFGLLVDQVGKKWVGCWSSALEVFDDSGATPSFTHLWVGNGSPIDNHTWVWSSAADAFGNRWFGMDTPNLGCNCPQDPIGIDLYGRADTLLANFQTTNTPDLLGNQIRALSVDRLGTLWVGHALKGVQSFTLDSLNMKLVPTTPGGFPTTGQWNVFGVEAHNDSIWVFSDGDLRLYAGFGTAAAKFYAIPAAPASRGAIHPLAVAPDGTAWVGSVNGARVYHPGGQTEDLTVQNSPLANDEIRSIVIDQKTGVVWIATAGGINRFDPGYRTPAPPRLARLDVLVYPNPALLANGMGVSLRVAGNGVSYRGAVYDLNGRMLRRLSAGANGQILWDGRDADGKVVRPGLYFIRVEAGGRSAVARVTLLR